MKLTAAKNYLVYDINVVFSLHSTAAMDRIKSLIKVSCFSNDILPTKRELLPPSDPRNDILLLWIDP